MPLGSRQLTGASGPRFFANLASFPVFGMSGVLYVDSSTGESYIWTGLAYDLSFDIDAGLAAHVADADPHTQYATDSAVSADIDSAISAHAADSNPHPNLDWSLEDLLNVRTTGAVAGNVLAFNGALWVDTNIEDLVGAQYLTFIDEVSDTVTYVGDALPATTTSESLWRIKRITTSGNDIAIQWADGTRDFVNVWDDRLTYTYS